MFPILIGVLAWLPAILGYGFLFWTLLKRFAPDIEHESTLMVFAVPGLALLSLIANLVNFFLPVNSGVALLTFVIGWLCFVMLVRQFSLGQFQSISFVIFALILLASISLTAAKPIFDYESGWYHLQTIRWITTNRAPLGLANLYGLYTYNSAWFSTLAILQVPLMEGQSIYVLNPLLLFVYGLDIGLAATRFKDSNQSSFSNTYLIFTSIVWLEQLIGVHVNSASADLAVVLFTLLSVAVCIRAVEQAQTFRRSFLVGVVIAAYALTMKLSSAPLFLTPLVLMLYQVTKSNWQAVSRAYKDLMVLTPIITAVFLSIWIIRSVVLSGCIVYPIEATCLRSLPWTASVATVDADMTAIRYWARNPWGDPKLALEGWGWFEPWLKQNVSANLVVVVALILVVSYVLYWLGSRKGKPAASDRPHLALSLAMPVGGSILWFFSAPDPRFGEGYLWAILLIPFGLGFYRFYSAYALRNLSRLFAACGALLAIFILGFWPVLAPKPWPVSVPWLKNNDELHLPVADLLWRWPPIPNPQLKAALATDGTVVFSPIYREQCWNVPVICTPQITEGLTASSDLQGQIVMFLLDSSQ